MNDGASPQTIGTQPCWRLLKPGLWVGHLADRCVGTIERGRRFTRVDPDGRPVGTFGTLEEAQRADVPLRPAPARPAPPRVARLLLLSGLATAVAVGIWIAGELLLR